MPKIGWFSTDFSAEPVIDEQASRMAGKPIVVPGQQRLSYGGTFMQRGAMPAIAMQEFGDWECIISWQFRAADDGHLQVMDKDGEWHSPEIFYSQRWMHQDAESQMRRARATGQRVVADLDDDFFFGALPSTNIAAHTTDPKNNPTFNRDHYWRMLGACDAITVSTEHLRRKVERLGVPTYILRNAIDIDRWQPNDPTTDGFIAWVGGIQWRAHDIAVLRQFLPDFLEAHGLPVYHAGDSDVPGVPKFWDQAGIDTNKTQVAIAKLCHIADYPSLWAPINISLIPLEKCQFNQAKSWLKALESCAAGVPYVVSAGFYEHDLLIAEGTAGRAARNDKPRQWVEHLTDLLDPDVRAKEGAINRSIAEAHDIRIQWKNWDEAYKAIMAL